MLIDCDYNLISMWRSIDEVIPYSQNKSGAKDGDKPVYKNPLPSSSNPVLALEFDILNEDGFGLKRGYYEIAVNEEYTCLMFIQANKIKAKIPIIKQELINEYGTDYEWPDEKDKKTPTAENNNPANEISLASKKIYQKIYTEKELKKRKEKYKKGMDPNFYFHSKVYLEYDKENDLYKVIWEKYNTRFIGIMKVK